MFPPSSRPRVLTAFLLLLLPLTACDDDDDDVPPGSLQNTFVAPLDQVQEIPVPVSGTRVRVTVTNRAPAMGTFQTPVWVGFHDGTFDLYDQGAPASMFFPATNALERLAEDGDSDPLTEAFEAFAADATQGTLAGVLGPEMGPIAPGETLTRVFELDATSAQNRYLSYASMVIPSNDAFIANGDPMAHEIFDAGGAFVATDFTVVGSQTLDAGTEVNDEVPANTAFFGQTTPDTGVAQGGNVDTHPGFMPMGSGGILDDPMFSQADFTAPGYEMLSFRFEELSTSPPPATGLATATLVGGTVDFTVMATGLSGTVTGVHFHMAAAGATGPIVLDLGGAVVDDSPDSFLAEGSLPAPAGFATALRNGNIYVNLHTALNPAGELRGQLVTDEAFTGTVEAAQEVPAPVLGTDVRLVVRNLAPSMGTFQTGTWFGFHNGSFDVLDMGSAAETYFPDTNGLERLAEDGDLDPISDGFAIQGFGTIQGRLTGVLGPMDGPIAPGETVSEVVRVNRTATTSRFFSYGTMVIPSNDAFIANGTPMAHEVFDAGGTFVASDFTVPGSDVLDAGTEANDEVPANTNFFGQTTPDTGVPEGGTVGPHPGFMPAGSGGILDDPMFAQADFTAPGYELLEVRFVESTPTESATGIVAAALDPGETVVTFAVTVRNLSGPVTDVHFHEGAPGVAGPILLDLGPTVVANADGVLVAEGTLPVDRAFVDALRAGNVYVNVHTTLNPAGEARGQVTLSD